MSTKNAPYIRPGFVLAHLVNPVVRRLGTTTLLTVPGRVTGKPHSTPLGTPFEYHGSRYLVSGRGQTQWVRNLRAAHGGELRVHRHSERFQAVEVSGLEHDAVVTAYRDKFGRSVQGYFERIPDPADHPVFRIEPEGQADEPEDRTDESGDQR